MDRKSVSRRAAGWVLPVLALLACGCQTVRTPEEQIAKLNLPRELSKTTMPDYVVETPDVIHVAVLQAAPGRQLDGDRLVRPDGKISLDFYGDVYVAGLTTDQIKEKIIIHLRKSLTDDALGLIKYDEKTLEPLKDKDGNPVPVPPAESESVFVDVAQYNSKVYYVQGDVSLQGRFPITGNETVLDAINYAGGLLPTAAFQNIRLVRPAPPDACCAQTLPVNLPAIINAGDTTTNYQLMPGDRIMVFRDPIVRTSVLLNRLSEPFQIVVNNIFSYSLIKNALRRNAFGSTATSSTTSRTVLPATSSSGR